MEHVTMPPGSYADVLKYGARGGAERPPDWKPVSVGCEPGSKAPDPARDSSSFFFFSLRRDVTVFRKFCGSPEGSSSSYTESETTSSLSLMERNPQEPTGTVKNPEEPTVTQRNPQDL
ncbi:hypothetical protein EYF80_040204 [Liparis tanakae]|uniref:Uncharacterized protein n=1 Tax=Liparis tanakae TaxID=230148 RepID=A0A4Z2G7N4_9TELE|nr:hypothetical protein EYF80_040204 [Liparis tanakae]